MSNYSYFEKVLHRQFLGESILSKTIFKSLISKAKALSKENTKSHIFITGLARSGTTAVLNKFYSTDELDSFTYKSMPFILSPNLSKIYSKFNKPNINPKERFHKDGIKISVNSPECLDEIFWVKYKSNRRYKNCLEPEKLKTEVLKSYSYLINSFSEIQRNKRMLIKNNNNHLRVEHLSEFFSNSNFLIFFRDPLFQSYSLLNQHRNFTNLQSQDPFILEYMNLIGHNEFGLNTMPFKYSHDDNWFKNKNKLEINYWLEQWIKTYQWILNNNFSDRKNVFLVSYEELSNKKTLFSKICDICGILNKNSGLFFFNANEKLNIKNMVFDQELVNKALKIYQQLSQISLK